MTSTPRPVHTLDAPEFAAVALANRLLTAVTSGHAVCCACPLCEARMLTDVQDDESRRVRYEPAEDAATLPPP